MNKKFRNSHHLKSSVLIFLICFLTILIASSCGGSNKQTSAPKSTKKLPPGTTESQIKTTDQGKTKEQSEQNETQTKTTTPMRSADLAGGRFTVVAAKRPDSNSSVLTSGQREVKGDYLEIELSIQNIGTGLLDLSAFSFRLQSPGINASDYYEYYGDNGTYGKYVKTNTISATLLNYSDLSKATFKLKEGEVLDSVFLFFDLNPMSTSRNQNVTKENTNLVIRKVSGDNYGSEVTIPLTDYPDS